MAPYEALYGRRCRSPSCWLEVGERQLAKTELVQQASEKIEVARKCMKIAQDRQKYYADHRARNLEFQEGDRVFLRISPQRPSMRNRKQGKLSPRFMGPYRIIERFIPDPKMEVPEEEVEVRQNLTYIERPVKILDRKEKKLRSKSIPLVKVQWNHHSDREATWELEEDLKRQFPELFVDVMEE
ncbi:uncharacterized protein LOC127788146 [Diospyros lotus]|uniref:uncharacterized protein LOC127788146 n=1 Tax=Diospyros lotus TaxID=55363 RepID=UPI002254FBDF|nr:uncharacterized protein LOC127788146 [Diospyros lotus]